MTGSGPSSFCAEKRRNSQREESPGKFGDLPVSGDRVIGESEATPDLSVHACIAPSFVGHSLVQRGNLLKNPGI